MRANGCARRAWPVNRRDDAARLVSGRAWRDARKVNQLKANVRLQTIKNQIIKNITAAIGT
jgi:hypothetical protein